MESGSDKQSEQEEYYDDIKLPIRLLENGEEHSNGILCHPSSSQNAWNEKCNCCDSCHTEDIYEDEIGDKKLYECPHCGLRFLLSIALKFHIKASHGPEQFYHCSYCSFNSHILSQVRRHVRESHTTEKRHCCPHCKYKAKRSTHLRRHIEARHDATRPRKRQYYKYDQECDIPRDVSVVEDEEKPLLCTLCSYSTSAPRSLRRHIRMVHEGNCAVHKCTQCDYSCSQLRELRHHIKVDHENVKCFDCPLCDYKTVHLGSLKNHIMAKHTDEKDHQCPHCSYKAVQSGNLKRHMKTKHPNKLKNRNRRLK